MSDETPISTSEIVESMATYLSDDITIAEILQMNVNELRDKYHSEIETGRAKSKAKIGETLFNQAMSGNTAALIFLGKSLLGLSDRPKKAETSTRALKSKILKIPQSK